MKVKALFQIQLATLCLLLSIVTASADDTEIYFAQNSAQPNILFVLDLSGSMGWALDRTGSPRFGEPSRLQEMQSAMRAILNEPANANLNVGLMTFAGGQRTNLDVAVSALDDAHRDLMLTTINGLRARGTTPTIEALYEAGLYFAGRKPRLGLTRQYSANDRGNSLIPPDSYRLNGGSIGNAGRTNEFLQGDDVRYVSPMNHECQTDHIVLLSDGEPSAPSRLAFRVNGDNIGSERDLYDTVVPAEIGKQCDVSLLPRAQNGKCGEEIAEHLLETLEVKTHTIGFAQLNSQWFRRVSEDYGGGNYYTAQNAQALTTAFSDIIDTATVSATAPAIPVNSYNESRHDGYLYYTLFEPRRSARWAGNVKKYRLSDELDDTGAIKGIVDAAGETIIGDDGLIKPTSRSFWSTTPDGANVEDGGYAERLQFPRTWYTDATDSPMNRGVRQITAVGQVNQNWLVDTPNTISNGERNAIVRWALAADALDEVAGNHSRFAADSLHSSPQTLTYNVTARDPQQKEEVLFTVDNMGMLHVLDTTTGNELWAYSPAELLPNLGHYLYNTGSTKRYGLDGPMTLYSTRNNDNSAYKFEVEDAWLYLTERRGGNRIYALDVARATEATDPFNIMWKITGGLGQFRNLGQTWSKPQMITVKTDCTTGCGKKKVLLFSGGYNDLYDDMTLDMNGPRVENASNGNGHGNAIYMVDPETGALLWSAGKGAHHDLNLANMNHSIPTTPVPVDSDADGYIDVLFASDIAGNVWRIDIDNEAAALDELHLAGGRIAALGEPGANLRFFPRIDVVQNSYTYETARFLLTLGSGARSSPLYNEYENNGGVKNRLYVIRDGWVFSNPVSDTPGANGEYPPEYRYSTDAATGNPDIIRTDNLVNLETRAVDPATESDFHGYFLPLADNDEKILESATATGNRLFFASYMPPDPTIATDTCSFSIGTTRLYILDLLSGANVIPPDPGGRYITVGAGILNTGIIVDTGSSSGLDFVMGLNTIKLDALLGGGSTWLRSFKRTGWVELENY